MADEISTPDHRDTIIGFARAGYAARGIVYLLIGSLAALAAVGPGGETTDSRGALMTLLGAPLGDLMLGAIALGLTGYALWRTIQAVKDTDHHGRDAKGLAVRGGLAVSAIVHLLLAMFAVNLIFAIGGSESGSSQGTAGWLMQQPYGRLLVGIVGVAITGAGIAHAVKGWRVEFHRHFDMPTPVQTWAYPVCRFGLVIRGVVLVIVGGFFLVAAYQVDPSEAGGLKEVFNTVRQQLFGTVLLAVMATGLVAFGIYSILEAVYRRVCPFA